MAHTAIASSTDEPANARRAMIVGAVLNSVGPLGVWSMPLILAVFSHSIELDNTRAGMLASAALTGACLMALVQALLFRVLRQRPIALTCIAALLFSYLGLLSPLTIGVAIGLMFILGLGMGGLLVISLNAAEASGRISRVSAAGLVGQAGISAAIAWAVSQYTGLRSDQLLAALLMLITAAALAIVPWIPNSSVAVARKTEESTQPSALLWIALAAWGLANFASGGFWPLTERIGVANGLSHTGIAQAIAYSSLAGISGAVAAFLFGRSLALLLAILIIGIGTALSVIGIANSFAAASFAAAMIGFGFLWNFAPPYQLPVISTADRTGNGMAWTILFLKVFMALGPIIYGALADGFGFGASAMLAAAASLVSMAMFCTILFIRRRTAVTQIRHENPTVKEISL